MSIVIAIIPPKKSIDAIRNASGQYSENMDTRTPEDTWHVGLASVDAVPPLTPLRQSFHQTLKIVSIGEGEPKGVLWVRLQMNPSLAALRTLFTQDTAPCTPHITLGSFANVPAFGILDTPLALAFSVHELHVIQTDPYEILGIIPLTS